MRITDKELRAVIDRINVVTGSPAKPYVDGKPQASRRQGAITCQVRMVVWLCTAWRRRVPA